MPSTLYILRKQPDAISPTLFQPGDSNIEVVFVEQVPPMASSFGNGSFVSDKKVAGGSTIPVISYDDLVMKIFSCDHTIVL